MGIAGRNTEIEEGVHRLKNPLLAKDQFKQAGEEIPLNPEFPEWFVVRALIVVGDPKQPNTWRITFHERPKRSNLRPGAYSLPGGRVKPHDNLHQAIEERLATELFFEGQPFPNPTKPYPIILITKNQEALTVYYLVQLPEAEFEPRLEEDRFPSYHLESIPFWDNETDGPKLPFGYDRALIQILRSRADLRPGYIHLVQRQLNQLRIEWEMSSIAGACRALSEDGSNVQHKKIASQGLRVLEQVNYLLQKNNLTHEITGETKEARVSRQLALYHQLHDLLTEIWNIASNLGVDTVPLDQLTKKTLYLYALLGDFPDFFDYASLPASWEGTINSILEALDSLTLLSLDDQDVRQAFDKQLYDVDGRPVQGVIAIHRVYSKLFTEPEGTQMRLKLAKALGWRPNTARWFAPNERTGEYLILIPQDNNEQIKARLQSLLARIDAPDQG